MVEAIIAAVSAIAAPAITSGTQAAQRGEDYDRELRKANPEIAELDAKIIRVRDRMWRTPIFTPEREDLERKVNRLISERDQLVARGVAKVGAGTPRAASGGGGGSRGPKKNALVKSGGSSSMWAWGLGLFALLLGGVYLWRRK